MKKSIGIDVAKRKLDISFYDGRQHQRVSCSNTETAIRDMLDRIGHPDKQDALVTMEATGSYHERAAIYFYQAGYRVSVMNPLIIKRYGEMKMLRAKTDPVDARLIAEYGYDQKPMWYTPKTPENQGIIHILKTIEGFQGLKTQNNNRLEALTQSPFCSEHAAASIRNINEAIDREIKQLEGQLAKIMREQHNEAYKRLLGIPGIGKRLASAIIGYFGAFERFEKSKQVACFVGLNPFPKESGSSIKGRGAMARKGNRYLRKLFFLGALSASKYNHDCAKLYNRLLLSGKRKKVALIAVANKLIRQVFAVIKYQREYIPFFQTA
jgi:transposase